MKQVEPLFFLARSGQECANGHPQTLSKSMSSVPRRDFHLASQAGLPVLRICFALVILLIDRELVKPNSFALVNPSSCAIRIADDGRYLARRDPTAAQDLRREPNQAHRVVSRMWTLTC